MKKYTVTAANLKEPITNVSAPSPERAIEKVEFAIGKSLYKAEADETMNEIENGCKVVFIQPYGNNGEIFTVSQWDEARRRGWAGDCDGRGWYFYSDQVEVVDEEEEEGEDEN